MTGAPEQGIVLYDHSLPFAWGGRLAVPPDSARGGVGALHTPFYTVLYAVRSRGPREAVATAVAYAEPPADRKIRQQMAERRSLYNQIAELTNRIKQTT